MRGSGYQIMREKNSQFSLEMMIDYKTEKFMVEIVKRIGKIQKIFCLIVAQKITESSGNLLQLHTIDTEYFI